MKAILTALALGASVAAAAQTSAPTYPLAQTGTSVIIGLDSTIMDLDGLDSGHRQFGGIHIGLERVISRSENLFVTVNGVLGYASSHDNQATPEGNKAAQNVQDNSIDYSLLTATLGVDWNLKLGEQTYVYAGPRLGWAQYKWEPNAKGAKGDDVSYIGVGAEVGVRYFATPRCSVNFSVRSMGYAEQDEVAPQTTTVNLGVNWSF